MRDLITNARISAYDAHFFVSDALPEESSYFANKCKLITSPRVYLLLQLRDHLSLSVERAKLFLVMEAFDDVTKSQCGRP